MGLRAARRTAHIMNDFSNGSQTADRLRHALENSLRLRAQLETTRQGTRTLVDTFNNELRTYVSGETMRVVAEATGRSTR